MTPFKTSLFALVATSVATSVATNVAAYDDDASQVTAACEPGPAYLSDEDPLRATVSCDSGGHTASSESRQDYVLRGSAQDQAQLAAIVNVSSWRSDRFELKGTSETKVVPVRMSLYWRVKLETWCSGYGGGSAMASIQFPPHPALAIWQQCTHGSYQQSFANDGSYQVASELPAATQASVLSYESWVSVEIELSTQAATPFFDPNRLAVSGYAGTGMVGSEMVNGLATFEISDLHFIAVDPDAVDGLWIELEGQVFPIEGALPPAPSGGDEGGCALGRGTSDASPLMALLSALFVLRRRERRGTKHDREARLGRVEAHSA